ncbi:Uncharacterised protein [Mycobacteroides abscessus subsp. abscessus]|nr:Uncharacterised protein [Mycobacteroides abscessus subsp. abscessus]
MRRGDHRNGDESVDEYIRGPTDLIGTARHDDQHDEDREVDKQSEPSKSDHAHPYSGGRQHTRETPDGVEHRDHDAERGAVGRRIEEHCRQHEDREQHAQHDLHSDAEKCVIDQDLGDARLVDQLSQAELRCLAIRVARAPIAQTPIAQPPRP